MVLLQDTSLTNFFWLY